MISNIQQKGIIRNYINIVLEGDFEKGATYILVIDKNQQGQTIDRWVQDEEGSHIVNPILLEQVIEQFNRDTIKN
jgi:hypothetical protein